MEKRYIDYEELRRILKNRQTVRGTPERRDEIGEIIAIIDNMSTDRGIHARWLTTEAYPHWLYCSNCHMRFVPDHEWIAAYSIPANFCPHCGKPMWNGNFQNIWCGDMLTPKTFEVIDREKLIERIKYYFEHTNGEAHYAYGVTLNEIRNAQAQYVTPEKADVTEDMRSVGESAKNVTGALENVAVALENAEHCVCCGDVIPEGRQVCPRCDEGICDG